MEVCINNGVSNGPQTLSRDGTVHASISLPSVPAGKLLPSASNSFAVKEFDSIKTFKCFACRQTRAKYRCPGCSTPTCSLPCVRKHKLLLECDGQRSRVKFRRLEQFTNLDMLSDYRLLEEITRDNESKRRKPTYPKREGRKVKLKDNVRVLCDVVLHLLPPHFVRAKQNDSRWDWKNKVARWRIEWNFQGNVIQTAPLRDSFILKSALFNATSQMPKEERKKWKKIIKSQSLKLTLKQEKGMSSEMIRRLRQGGDDGDDDDDSSGGGGGAAKPDAVRLEENVRWPANLGTTIASNLRGSTFIEFPTFLVEALTPDGKPEAVIKEDGRKGKEDEGMVVGKVNGVKANGNDEEGSGDDDDDTEDSDDDDDDVDDDRDDEENEEQDVKEEDYDMEGTDVEGIDDEEEYEKSVNEEEADSAEEEVEDEANVENDVSISEEAEEEGEEDDDLEAAIEEEKSESERDTSSSDDR